ncbi:MAG: hypothetical protein HY903_15720 [Deltaproteobacteria bacterium]|nr:hypothetical protein [Deltaproteobacteria bacterium]
MFKSVSPCVAVVLVAVAGCGSPTDEGGRYSGSGGGGDPAAGGDHNGSADPVSGSDHNGGADPVSGSDHNGGADPVSESDHNGAGDPVAGGDHDGAGDPAAGGDNDGGDAASNPVWRCSASYYGTDDGCDCGCGRIDPDCTDGCAAAGCGAAGCQYCYDANGAAIASCPPPPRPSGWTCGSGLWGDGACDCGCGVEDYECYLGSCTTPGCVSNVCDVCHDGPSVIACTPGGWLCSQAEFQDFSCDCGCGIVDPSCIGGCTTPGCRDDGCDLCHTTGGAIAVCAPVAYTCGEDAWQDYSCDCGCGVDDKGCYGGSCTTPGCLASSCDVCHDGASTNSCVPPAYTCGQAAWDDYYCDCGCGAADRGCATGGCTTPGCLANVCDVCHDGASTNSCMPATYTCGQAAWDDYYCDCGCGAVDHECLAGSCTTPGCVSDACEICHDGANTISCLPAAWSCPESYWVDLTCDCGCGAPDAYDCGTGGCATPGCTATGCNFCWGGANTGGCP